MTELIAFGALETVIIIIVVALPTMHPSHDNLQVRGSRVCCGCKVSHRDMGVGDRVVVKSLLSNFTPPEIVQTSYCT